MVKQVLGRDQGLAAQHAAQAFDLGLAANRRGWPRCASRVFLPSRQPSRRRMAGRELRLGTVSMYMGAMIHHINHVVKENISYYMGTYCNPRFSQLLL